MELRAGAGKLAALGSIKANIGHTKAAAGSAGLIKTVLAVSTGLIPPATGFSRPHPLLEGAASALWLPRAPYSWPDGARIAGVSAMGTGGGNAHLVLRGQTDRGRHKRKGRSERPGETTEAMLAIDPAKQPSQPADGQPQATAYLLNAPDRKALLQVLARIAQISPWLSDAEMRDLACQLARDTREQGPMRMAIVASRQEQLARLATDAMTMLPRLADGLLAVQPGIYAADGGDGRVTLLLSGIRPGGAWPGGPWPGGNPLGGNQHGRNQHGRNQHGRNQHGRNQHGGARPRVNQHGGNEDNRNQDNRDQDNRDQDNRNEDRDTSERSLIGPADVVLSSLSALHKLDPLGVNGTVAVGHGLGDLAGLVWAGCITEADAINLAVRLDEILATAQAQHSGPGERAARLRAAAAQLKLTAPHRRLISAATGREVASIPDVTEVMCAQLEPPRGAEQALKAGAVGASLLLETGPGQALSEAVPGWARVPVVSLAGEESGKDATRAAAALFAAGALGNPAALADGQQSRRIDIWREQIFITNPCQTEPRGQAAPAVRPPQPSAPRGASGPARAAGPAPSGAAAAPAAAGAAAGRPRPGLPRGPPRPGLPPGPPRPGLPRGPPRPGLPTAPPGLPHPPLLAASRPPTGQRPALTRPGQAPFPAVRRGPAAGGRLAADSRRVWFQASLPGSAALRSNCSRRTARWPCPRPAGVGG